MQSEQFASRVHPLPTLASFDEEFEREQVDLDPEAERGGRLIRSVGHLLGLTVLGIVLALLCSSFGDQLWSDMRFWSGSSGQPTQGASNFGSAEQLSHALRELDALKKDVSELGAMYEQMAASITALQAGQQEQRGTSFQGWYSNSAVLMSRIVTAQEDKQKPTVRGSNAGRRIEAAPLQLRP
jgi:hypothetical protein